MAILLRLGSIALVIAASVAAQPAPNSVVIASNPPVAISPAGVLTTLQSLPIGDQITSIAPAPDNDGVLIAVQSFPRKPYVAHWRNGVSTTLGAAYTIPNASELRVDSRGKILVVGTTPFGQAGSGELENGMFKLKFEAQVGHAANMSPLRVMIDPTNDRIICVTGFGEILSIGREIPASITTLTASSVFAYPGGVAAHPRAWKLIIEGTHGDFWVFDRLAGTKSRLHDAPTDVVATIDWIVDPYRNAIVVLRARTSLHELVAIDAESGMTTTLWSSPSAPPNRPIALLGSRLLGHHSGTARPGEMYRMRVSAPAYPHGHYFLGASLNPIPGMQLGSRHLPLTPDSVFHASLTNPAIYEAFEGPLDANGEGVATYHVQTALAGQRIFFAVVIIANAAIQAVSLPYGVTIELAS